MKRLVVLALALGAAAGAARSAEAELDLGGGRTLRYTVLDASSALPSAKPVALQVLQLLAEGRIEEAAAHSNAPQRRLEVLRDYRAQVGEEGFRQVFARYLEAGERVVAEVARGPHRLIIWDLGAPALPLAGQFYVESAGRFVLDDAPGAQRAQMQRILRHYREAARPSARTE